jgi:hypothetical protein
VLECLGIQKNLAKFVCDWKINDVYWVPWITVYILLQITCYKYRKYIYLSAWKLFNQCKMTPPIFASNTVNYSSNKKNSKPCSLGSIFNRVNIHMSGSSIMRKECVSKAVEKWPRVYFQRSSKLCLNATCKLILYIPLWHHFFGSVNC